MFQAQGTLLCSYAGSLGCAWLPFVTLALSFVITNETESVPVPIKDLHLYSGKDLFSRILLLQLSFFFFLVLKTVPWLMNFSSYWSISAFSSHFLLSPLQLGFHHRYFAETVFFVLPNPMIISVIILDLSGAFQMTYLSPSSLHFQDITVSSFTPKDRVSFAGNSFSTRTLN